MKNMNNVREKVTERRNQTLILVEGEHEKGVLLRILLKCFPEIPKRYLCERVPTLYEEQAVDAVDRILTLSEEEKLIPCIDLILGSIISDNSLRNTLNHYFESDIRKIGYAKKQMDFWTSMRQMFLYITKLNIAKAWNIQMGAKNNDEVSLKAKYLEIDMQRILLTQNEASRDDKNGFIWVLCTCLMFLGEYKFFWKS